MPALTLGWQQLTSIQAMNMVLIIKLMLLPSRSAKNEADVFIANGRYERVRLAEMRQKCVTVFYRLARSQLCWILSILSLSSMLFNRFMMYFQK